MKPAGVAAYEVAYNQTNNFGFWILDFGLKYTDRAGTGAGTYVARARVSDRLKGERQSAPPFNVEFPARAKGLAVQSKIQNPKSKMRSLAAKLASRRYTPILIAALVLAGCDSAVIEGKVFDARGETLPGVSVLTVDTPYETLTNGRGEYRVRFVPRQEFHVKFFKTGYTTGDLRIQKVLEARSVVANPISLISLPEGPGVYLSNDRFSTYLRTTIDTPTSLERMADKSTVFGTHRQPVETLARKPFIVIYRGFTIPRYGIKLNRLEEVEVMPPAGVSGKEGLKAWVRSGEVPIDVREVDLGQGQLLSIAFSGELEFGAYAVHWGALDGALASEEPRIFCFRIIEQMTPVDDLAKPATKEATPRDAAKKPAPSAPAAQGATGPAEDDEG
jgi:hypothetical protein